MRPAENRKPEALSEIQLLKSEGERQGLEIQKGFSLSWQI
jgi:hypothetical protein